MKHIFLSLSVVVFFSQSIISNPYTEQATGWIQELTLIATPEELQFIANLIYFSGQRAQHTLQTQQALLTAADEAQKLWLAFIATRRDPLHEHTMSDQKTTQKIFEHAQYYALIHHKLGKIYDHVVKKLGNTNIISSVCHQLITNMRADARSAMVKDVFIELAQLTQQFITTQNFVEKAAQHYQQQHFFGTKRSWLTTLASYFPPLFMKSFITFDEDMLIAHDVLWKAWHETQSFTNYVWQSIETCRSQFYEAYYDALISLMKQRGLMQHYFDIMFDEQGFIPAQKRKTRLPDTLHKMTFL
ncbi:MAG: hypothetical protein WA432_03965 [Candidatus Babeliaceae bacterium]